MGAGLNPPPPFQNPPTNALSAGYEGAFHRLSHRLDCVRVIVNGGFDLLLRAELEKWPGFVNVPALFV
jgi:hypothetical protein